MLFVRCGNGGISHHPDETISADDADVATRALLHLLEHFVVESGEGRAVQPHFGPAASAR
jgi:hypothetical protein